MTDAPQRTVKCKLCPAEITWHKDPVSGKNYPKNLDGTPHRCIKKDAPAPEKTPDQIAKDREEYNKKAQAAGFNTGNSCTSPKPTPAPAESVGMYDPSKVLKVMMGCTINLHDFNNLKIEVEATDATTAKRALIEILGVTIPAESAVSRECINRYVKNVLAGGV